jgi:hypothetical protein
MKKRLTHDLDRDKIPILALMENLVTVILKSTDKTYKHDI